MKPLVSLALACAVAGAGLASAQTRTQSAAPAPAPPPAVDPACGSALSALARTGASVDERERASRSLMKSCQRPLPATAAASLRRLVSEGSSEAAAWLLLRDFPDEQTRALLGLAAEQRQGKLLKLGLAGPAVSPSLVAAIAQGTGIGERAGSVAEREFVLAAIGELTEGADLTRAVSFLDDEREARGGGAPSGKGPRLRVCDLAVQALADRLGWSPGPFALRPAQRYDAAERAAARAHFMGSIR